MPARSRRIGKIGYGMPLGPEEAQAETLLWLLGNGGGYQNAGGKWVINSPQNVETLEFMTKLVKAGDTEPNPGTKNRAVILEQFAQGQIGMLNGLTALLPIIKHGRRADRIATGAPRRSSARPVRSTRRSASATSSPPSRRMAPKQAAIKKFLDFACRISIRLPSRRNTTCCRARPRVRPPSRRSIRQLAPFIEALPKAVQYPNRSGLGAGEGADPADHRHRHRAGSEARAGQHPADGAEGQLSGQTGGPSSHERNDRQQARVAARRRRRPHQARRHGSPH